MTKRSFAVLAIFAVASGCWLFGETYPDLAFAAWLESRNSVSRTAFLLRAAVHLDSLALKAPPALPMPCPYRDQDGYAIISSWLASDEYPGVTILRDTTELPARVQENSGAGSLTSCLSERIGEDYAEAFEDLSHVNSRSWLLENSVPETKRHRIRRWEDIKSGRYVVLSAVGFSADRRKAVLFAAEYDGGWSMGSYWVFSRHRNVWRKSQVFCGWIV